MPDCWSGQRRRRHGKFEPCLLHSQAAERYRVFRQDLGVGRVRRPFFIDGKFTALRNLESRETGGVPGPRPVWPVGQQGESRYHFGPIRGTKHRFYDPESPIISLESAPIREACFRDGFARDCLLQQGVRCEPDLCGRSGDADELVHRLSPLRSCAAVAVTKMANGRPPPELCLPGGLTSPVPRGECDGQATDCPPAEGELTKDATSLRAWFSKCTKGVFLL